MGIRERRDMGEMNTFEELRDKYLVGKIWKTGDLVEANGYTGKVVNRGTNYLSFADEDGKIHKVWLHEISIDERNYRKEYDNYHSKPEQVERRSSRNKARRAMGDKAVKGKDVGHKDNNPLNNDPDNLRNEDPSKNRREPRLREDNLDEMAWYAKVMAKIDQLTHPRGYDKVVKDYVAGMKDKEHKKHPSAWASEVARQYRMSPRAVIMYINKLVQKGALPKELNAEYIPEQHSFKKFVNQIQEKKIEGLENKAKKSKYTYATLKKVYDRGMGAYKTNPGSVRPNVTSPQQWAMARVNSFLKGGHKQDDDLKESDYPTVTFLKKKKKEPEYKDSDISEKDGPCWDGYKQVGMKKKKGKDVPNCVPEETDLNEWGEVEEAAEYQGRKVTLNKPTKGDVKKSKVYVKNAKGNVVKVEFGDPDMQIQKDIPSRRKSFRARHNCDNPGPKWKARYWSCKAW